METRKYYISILIIIFASLTQLTSCKQEKEINKNSTPHYIEVFNNNLKNKPKLFLKYWENMSEDDYIKVSKLLIQEEIIEKVKNTSSYIDLKENYFQLVTSDIYGKPMIIPHFIENKLKSIKLHFEIKPTFNSFYKLYEKKYGLQRLDSICTLTNVYQENNPDYKHYNSNKEKEIDELNKTQNDNSNFVIGKIPIDKKKYAKNYYFKILPENLKTKQNGILIFFNQYKVRNMNRDENLETFKSYRYSINFNNSNKLMRDQETIGKDFNSKTRIVLEYYKFYYEITYISEKMFEKNKSIEQKKYLNDKNQEKINTEKELQKNKKITEKNYQNI